MPSIWIKGGNQRGRRKEKKKKIKRGNKLEYGRKEKWKRRAKER